MKTIRTTAQQIIEREAILKGLWYTSQATEELAKQIAKKGAELSKKADRVRKDELMRTVVKRHVERARTRNERS